MKVKKKDKYLKYFRARVCKVTKCNFYIIDVKFLNKFTGENLTIYLKA